MADDLRINPEAARARAFATENFERWQKSLQDFAYLAEAVPGASDIDCLVHAESVNEDGQLRDSFLVIEAKAVSENIPIGQRRLFAGLKRAGFTVVSAYGPDKNGLFNMGFDWKAKGVTKDELAARIGAWWRAQREAA